MDKVYRLSFLPPAGWAGPRVERLVVGARGGLALSFLLLFQFSLDEKIQHLTQNEISSEHTVLQLQPAPPNNPFSLDCSVFIGFDRLRSQLKNGSPTPIGLS